VSGTGRDQRGPMRRGLTSSWTDLHISASVQTNGTFVFGDSI
jgi:hypothetical protein